MNRRKDGSLYDEEMTIAPVRDAEGEVAYFVAIKSDITARRIAPKSGLRCSLKPWKTALI